MFLLMYIVQVLERTEAGPDIQKYVVYVMKLISFHFLIYYDSTLFIFEAIVKVQQFP